MVTFDIRDVTDEVAQKFESEFFLRKKTLETYLASSNFSQSFSGNIHVEVSEYTPPVSQALIPAWKGCRGRMKFAALRARQGNAAILHELAHVYAPNQVRFLAEGYAVYLEEKIGNINAYPTFGSSIEARLRDTSLSALGLVKLDDFDRVPVGTGVWLGDNVGLNASIPATSERRAYSYLVSASFVKFVVDSYGLDKFHALYELTPLTPAASTQADSGRYKNVFGKFLSALQIEWLGWLESKNLPLHAPGA